MTAAEIAGHLPDGRAVEAVILAGGGLTARVLTLGATVSSLRVEALGREVVLAPPRLQGYAEGHIYAGTIVGPFANRIAQGRFSIDGEAFQADRNFLGRHTLHGGQDGPHARLWEITQVTGDAVGMTLTLPDGHMGFPGPVTLEAVLRLADGALDVRLAAKTARTCPVNLAHHGYFNLAGGGDVTGHRLWIAADHYLPVDAEMIPTGEIAAVAGTPFDFREIRTLGHAGYDHNFCLSDGVRPPRPVARVEVDDLAMTIETDQPGLQVYDGAHFGGVPGRDGRALPAKAGLALETQHWPDAPNRPDFPDCILRPGDRYEAVTRYVFETPR